MAIPSTVKVGKADLLMLSAKAYLVGLRGTEGFDGLL